MKIVLFSLILVSSILSLACRNEPVSTQVNPVQPAVPKGPGPLPDRAFKAQILISDPPTKLQPGQTETIQVKAKNISDVTWWARGAEVNTRQDNAFYLAVASRWLDKDGKPLGLEAHNGLPKNVNPGEEVDVTLQFTAPDKPGEYTLEVDLVQETVTWFGDKGSTTSKTKVTVVK
jgi:hypothetical protein